MKYYALLIVAVFFLAGCSGKKETPIPQISAFSLNLGSFSLDSGWEIDASVQVKDFAMQQQGDLYKASFSYVVALTTPDGKKIEKINSGVSVKEQKEKPDDAQIEIQFNLDSTYKPGTYSVSIVITDELTKKTTTITKPISVE